MLGQIKNQPENHQFDVCGRGQAGHLHRHIRSRQIMREHAAQQSEREAEGGEAKHNAHALDIGTPCSSVDP